jgi:hypothetical protein
VPPLLLLLLVLQPPLELELELELLEPPSHPKPAAIHPASAKAMAKAQTVRLKRFIFPLL